MQRRARMSRMPLPLDRVQLLVNPALDRLLRNRQLERRVTLIWVLGNGGRVFIDGLGTHGTVLSSDARVDFV